MRLHETVSHLCVYIYTLNIESSVKKSAINHIINLDREPECGEEKTANIHEIAC